MYEVSEWHYLSLQRTHGDNVLALLIKHNTVDACTENTHVGYLQCQAECYDTKDQKKGERRREQSKRAQHDKNRGL